jgi:DNA (cytosine-5)-methyltransferase 1
MSVYYNDSDPFVCAWLRNLIAAKLLPAGDVDERPIEQVQASDVAGYTQAHFFAGIGGWPYALQLAGWGDRPVWTGSCPCQPFSAAGKGKAEDDARHLWPHWFRLIREQRPKRIFGEQVANGVGKGWWDVVSTELEAEAYTVGAVVLGSHSVGAPHIRPRLFFVGESDGPRRAQRAWQRGDDDQAAEPTAGETVVETGALVVGVDDAPASRRESPRQGTESQTRHEARVRVPSSGRNGGKRLADAQGGDGRLPVFGRRSQQESTELVGGGEARALADANGGKPSDGAVQRGGEYGLGPQDRGAGFWDAVEWIKCSDGKIRPVPTEPTLFPLAARLPNRLGIIRGSGNSINPYTATAFVSAYMECAP